MPQLATLEKATLQEIRWNGTQVEEKNTDGQPTKPFKVQFNPQTLKVSYSNQKAGGDQPKGSSVQFVGKGTTKLSLELWFDTTLTETQGPSADPADVRTLTRQVFDLMNPKPAGGKNKKNFIPPGVRFQWGAFLFEGVIDAMDETLEFFSSTGVPLRAGVTLTLSQQELQFKQLPGKAEGPGTGPLDQARAGDSVQSMADRKGDNSDWKQTALANGIENPRRLAPGTLVDFGGSLGPSASLGGALDLSGGVGLSASGSLRAGAGAGGAISLGFVSAGASGGATLASGVSGGMSGGISAGISAGGGIGGGIGASAGAGVGLTAGAAAGIGLTAGGSLGASASVDLAAGGDLSAGASASADAELR